MFHNPHNCLPKIRCVGLWLHKDQMRVENCVVKQLWPRHTCAATKFSCFRVLTQGPSSADRCLFDYFCAEAPTVIFWLVFFWVKSESNLIYLSKNETKKARIRDISRFATKVRIWFGLVWSRLRAMIQSKTFNMVESACLQCESWSFYFRNSPGLLASPFFIQIDTFGKWLRCLTMSVM